MKLLAIKKQTAQLIKNNIINPDDYLLDLVVKELKQNNENFKTITIEVDDNYTWNFNIQETVYLINVIENFITQYNFNEETKNNFYRRFSIPKRHGGRRYLIDPNPALKTVQRTILNYLQNTLNICHHNSAHAFTQEKDAYTNAVQHKNHKCIIELDIKDFFPSITKEVLIQEMDRNIILHNVFKLYHKLCDYIVLIATLDGVLPQGSPLSPFLTNVVMHYFDYTICKKMRNKEFPRYTYTRYADDMCFSANAFSYIKDVLQKTQETLHEISPTLNLKKDKTKLLKNTNKCYITGIKLNKDFNLSYGHEHKTKLKLELYNLFQGKEHNTVCKEEVQEVLGRFSYMKRIEPNYADYLERKLLTQFNSPAQTLHQHFKYLL